MDAAQQQPQQPQVQPCRYKVGKTLGAGSYSVVKECVHIDTGRYYAAKVINKRLMAGREHMVRLTVTVLSFPLPVYSCIVSSSPPSWVNKPCRKIGPE